MLANAPANSPTCHAREAGANLLNLFQKLRLPFHPDYPTANPTGTFFLPGARPGYRGTGGPAVLRVGTGRDGVACRKRNKINVGITHCG